MERPPRGSLLSIAVVLALLGGLMFAGALEAASASNWGAATGVFLLCVVVWVFAFNFYVAWRRLRGDGDE
jgi:hypothetical protein